MHTSRTRFAITALIASCAVVGHAATSSSITHAAGNTVDIVGPAGSQSFGFVLVLANGNYVVSDPSATVGGKPTAGAVYLYNGVTNQLISTLTGTTADDEVGGGGVIEVGSSNVAVISPLFDNGATSNVGAVTWMSGTTGLNATVSAANSFVGATAGDQLGDSKAVELTNGNYFIASKYWSNGVHAQAGAVTWAPGNAPLVGTVTAANSVIGTSTGDLVGGFYNTALPNGNYVISSPLWHNIANADAGAVTFGNGATGVHGPVGPANSLVGSVAGDEVGNHSITVLTNGSYVISSTLWHDGANQSVGGTTWASGTVGIVGSMSLANSLVGSTAGDHSQQSVTALANGNYVVSNPTWDKSGLPDAGAVTWGNGSGGTKGVIDVSNSLIGGGTNENVGQHIVPLVNGNYVVDSWNWSSAISANVGAVTWGNGNTGTTGIVSAANSFTGAHAADRVGGDGVTGLANGNYVIASSSWSNGATPSVGAVTWADGTTGIIGLPSLANSLIGSTATDQVGSGPGIIPLANGNYVVPSPNWNNGTAFNAGAVTWGNGAIGVLGVVGAANSLIGSSLNDMVGSAELTPLRNGNYVVASPAWDNGTIVDAGAATWGNGAIGTKGPIDATNSLIGATAGDAVGGAVIPLTNANYVVDSPNVSVTGVSKAGAATWGSGSTGIVGVVSNVNSLVGTSDDDHVGSSSVIALPNGAYVVGSPLYDNSRLTDSGATTLGTAAGVRGRVTSDNSAFGPTNGSGANTRVFTKRLTGGGAVVVAHPSDHVVTLLYPPVAAAADYVPLAPARLVDTRPGFATVDGLEAGGGALASGSIMQVSVAGRGGVAADATAAALNVTVTNPAAAGFVTVYPCGTAQPQASNVNFTAGTTVPNAVTAKIGTGGTVCIDASQSTDIVVDVDGYFPITSSYQPLVPARLFESRAGLSTIDGLQNGGGALTAGSMTAVQVTGRTGVPANATTAILNVTVTEPTVAGFVTVFPCGAPTPAASNVNYSPGQTIANLVVSQIGTNGSVCVLTSQPTQLVVDINGYFPAITNFRSVVPARLLETRGGLTTVDGQFNGLGLQTPANVVQLTVGGRGRVPAGATTVVLNVTVTEPQGAGFVTVFPCGINAPLASNLNYTAGQTVANAVVVKVGTNGSVCFFTSQPTHLVVDVSGSFGG